MLCHASTDELGDILLTIIADPVHDMVGKIANVVTWCSYIGAYVGGRARGSL